MNRLDLPVSLRSSTAPGEAHPTGPAERSGLQNGDRRDEARELVEVLVVDDDALVRALLREILEREEGVRVAGVAADAASALERAAALVPDVLVLDAELPRTESEEVLHRLQESGLRSKVLLLTQATDEESVLRALRRGALGYVAKHAAVAQIGRAVRAIAAGEAWVERRMMARLLADLSRLAREADGEHGPGSQLSLRERQIVQLIAAGKTNHEIAGALYLSPHTVKSHVSHILQKLALPNRTEVAIFAVKAGWVSRAA